MKSAAIGLGEFAYRLAKRPGPGDWLVLVTTANTSNTAKLLQEELRDFEIEAKCLFSPQSAEELKDFSQEHEQEFLIVAGLETFKGSEWSNLDLARSQLERTGNAALLVTEAEAKKLFHLAPNLGSWIGASLWDLLPSTERLSPEEKQARLKALQEWSGHNDEWVIKTAQEGALPHDPEYAEWLVLLDKGELLER
jgi:hypothetical protein